MTGAQVIEVIHTDLKKEGNGTDVPVHRHEQFWSLDGDILAEKCEGGYCNE